MTTMQTCEVGTTLVPFSAGSSGFVWLQVNEKYCFYSLFLLKMENNTAV
jgi:hypothetical protein